jgi:hypothetical protein
MRVRRQTKAESFQKMLDKYLDQHGGGEVEMKDVAAWAIRTGRYVVPQKDAVKQCVRELSEAARLQVFEDEKGRLVRKKHAVRIKGEDGKPIYLWADYNDMPADHVRLSLSQRRQGILDDCKQLKNDLDHYNDNTTGERLLFDFNFTQDLEELQNPTEYPDSPPDEDDDPTSSRNVP